MTYYFAVGNYPSIVFREAEFGAQWINIAKATKTNSGSVAGWQDSFAGQAVFQKVIFVRGYYIF